MHGRFVNNGRNTGKHEKYLFLEKYGQFLPRFFSVVGQGQGIPKIDFEEIIEKCFHLNFYLYIFRLVVYVRNQSTEPWCLYMNTEIVEVRENKSQLGFSANENFAKKILYLIWKTILRKFAFF